MLSPSHVIVNPTKNYLVKKKENYRMCDVFKRINHAMSIVIAWIDTPLVASMWMRGELYVYKL
jgi:hypothetical protein